MSNGNLGSLKFASRMVRLAFVSVWEKKEQKNGSKKYEATALVPKNDDKNLVIFSTAARNAIVNKWGPDPRKWSANLRSITFAPVGKDKNGESLFKIANWEQVLSIAGNGKNGIPFRNGDDMPYDGFAGMVAIKTSNERPLLLVDKSGTEYSALEEADKDEIYSGCFAQLIGTAYAWSHREGGNGFSFSLGGVRKLADGEPFISRATRDDFEDYDDMGESNFDDSVFVDAEGF